MKKLRIGIVGTGQRVCYHGGCVFTKSLENAECTDVMELAALCDVHPERLAHSKKMYETQFGYPINTYRDYHKMFAEAELDGVYIALPNHLHAEATIEALERGIHVLCEKPMAVNLAQCDQMIAAAKRTKKILAFAMQMRYRERYHRVREIIEKGWIGQPAMVWCTEYRGPFAEMKEWVWREEQSGGAIVEKNCHHYDIFNLWLQSEPTTVYASGNILKHRAPQGRKAEIVDNAWVINDFANGARAMLGICFLASAAQKHEREFGIIGTEGKVFFSLVDQETIHVQRSNGEEVTFKTLAVMRGGLFRDFLDSILLGRQPLVTPEIARASLLVPLAAEKSIKEGRVVHVSELT